MEINNELRDRAYQCACKHGFHDKEYSDAHWMMLIITEISEAVNADRNGKHANKEHIEDELTNLESKGYFARGFDYLIKGSTEEELADVVIRCLDYAGLKNIDINSISPNYPCCYDEDEATFTEYMFDALRDLIIPPITLIGKYQINRVISSMFEVADKLGVDLFYHIEQKMKYNELRPMLNGKNY